MQRQFPDTCKKVTSNVVASCILIAQGTERMRQECATVEADLAGSGGLPTAASKWVILHLRVFGVVKSKSQVAEPIGESGLRSNGSDV